MAFGEFEIHGGDFKIGKHHQFTGKKWILKTKGKFFKECIKADKIETLEVASEENVKNLGGAVGWGIAGGLLTGGVGLLAGALLGGQGKNVTFICKLKDGRKFMATAKNKDFIKMQAAMF